MPEQRFQRCLHDACEDGDLQSAEDEQMHEPGRDKGVLEAGRDTLADSQHDAEQHRGVGRWERCVERGRVASTDPRRESREAGSVAGHVKAGGLELDVDVSLSQVGTAIEIGQVAGQHELAGGLDLVAEGGLGRAAPADHQVSDAGDRCRADHDGGRLDQDLTATG